MSERGGHAREIKFALSDVCALLTALGMLEDRKAFTRQPRGFLVRCPVHDDRSPSCSVQENGGIIVWNCHACGATGDALSLVAIAHGLDLKANFRDVLLAAAEIAGLYSVIEELRSGKVDANRKSVARVVPVSTPEREYPPSREVSELLASCTSVASDGAVSTWMRSRRIDPERVSGDLALALPENASSPRWAGYQGTPWARTGHRLIVPMRDSTGEIRSVRAGRIIDGDSPKRLPPGGYRASGLVMTDSLGASLLAGKYRAKRIVIVEGEPDFLTWATRRTGKPLAVMGVVNGSWTEGIAGRISAGCVVFVRTDHDAAGRRYSAAIVESLRDGRALRGWLPRDGAKDQNDLLMSGLLPEDPADDSRPIGMPARALALRNIGT